MTKPGSAMVVVSDFGEGGEVLLTLDRNRLGLVPDIAAADMETNLPVEVTPEGKVSIVLKKHDFAIVKIYSR